jgi:hypothetical protein
MRATTNGFMEVPPHVPPVLLLLPVHQLLPGTQLVLSVQSTNLDSTPVPPPFAQLQLQPSPGLISLPVHERLYLLD